MNIYQENGYKSRNDYLKFLAEYHDVNFASLVELAEMLGPEEDFDGLISSIEDYVCFMRN